MNPYRSLLTFLAAAGIILIFLITALPAQASYDPAMGFATEVVLNKEGIDYDLSILEEKAGELGVTVIVVEEYEKDYSSYDTDSKDDGYDTDSKEDDYEKASSAEEEGGGSSSSEEAPQPPDEDPDSEKTTDPSQPQFFWDPGTYYVFPSHYNDELAVVIRDVDDTYYSDTDEFTLEGLSIIVAIQIQKEIVTYSWETETLSLDTEVRFTEDTVQEMEELGWGGYYEEEWGMMYLEKEGVSAFIATGEGGKTPDGPGEEGSTYIFVDSSQEGLPDWVDLDMQAMLELFGMNGSVWEEAESETFTYEGWGIAPKGNMTPEDLDWGAAVTAEIDWLQELDALTGVTGGDKDAIEKAVGPGTAGYNSRVYFDQGVWQENPNPGFRKLDDYWNQVLDDQEAGGDSEDDRSYGTVFTIDLENLPGSSTQNPGSEGDTLSRARLIIALMVIPIVIFIIIILSVLSFTRLRRNNLLANLNRKNIYEAIKGKEGIHFNGLQDALDLKPGVLSHHLNILETEEYIKSRQDGKFRRFFLYETKSELRIYLTTVQQRILQAVSDSPGISQAKISKNIGSSRMMVNYHLKILRDAGIVDIEKEGRESACYTTELAKSYLPEAG